MISNNHPLDDIYSIIIDYILDNKTLFHLKSISKKVKRIIEKYIKFKVYKHPELSIKYFIFYKKQYTTSFKQIISIHRCPFNLFIEEIKSTSNYSTVTLRHGLYFKKEINSKRNRCIVKINNYYFGIKHGIFSIYVNNKLKKKEIFYMGKLIN